MLARPQLFLRRFFLQQCRILFLNLELHQLHLKIFCLGLLELVLFLLSDFLPVCLNLDEIVQLLEKVDIDGIIFFVVISNDLLWGNDWSWKIKWYFELLDQMIKLGFLRWGFSVGYLENVSDL